MYSSATFTESCPSDVQTNFLKLCVLPEHEIVITMAVNCESWQELLQQTRAPQESGH